MSVKAHNGQVRRLAAMLGAAMVALGAVAVAPPLKAAAAAGGSWPQVRFDAAHTGYNPLESTINAGNVSTLQPAWSFDPQEYPAPSPVVANGVAYLSCQKSKECALDTRTGKVLWTQQVFGDYRTSPGALSGGVLYVGSDSAPPAKMYALSASTGDMIWSASADPIDLVSDGFKSPTVANGVVYAEDDAADLYAFNATTGARIFKVWAGTFAAPAYASGTLYGSGETSTYQGLLKAFSGSTGQKRWNSAPQNRLSPGAAVAGANVYNGPFAYPAACADGCQPTWTFRAPSGSVTQPAVANGVVYEAYDDGNLYAINADRGTLRWTGITADSLQSPHAPMLSAPVVAGGVVYVADGAGFIDAFNAAGCGAASCQPLWQVNLNHHQPFQQDLVVVDGTVYVGSSDQSSLSSVVYAYRLPPSLPPPSGPDSVQRAVSTVQYHLSNSDGATFTPMDAGRLSLTITPATDETAVLGGNADLWTANAGYGQDIGITVNDGQHGDQLIGWKESGGLAGTFSPNAAQLETVYRLTAGVTYTFRLVWKTSRPAAGATIYAGAGPINGEFSPTSLVARLLAPANVTTVVSTRQDGLVIDDGAGWVGLLETFVTPATDAADGDFQAGSF